MSSPRFDLPITTSPAARTIAERDVSVPDQAPMAPLVEPESFPLVLQPSSEPLVPIEHRRIRNLGNYWHAGWRYARPVTLLRQGAFARLSAVADALPDRFGLAIFDAWRPLDLQAELYTAAYADPLLPEGFVSPADPNPSTPPPHLTGGTVDLTLTVDGIPLAPGAGFDDFTSAAHADAIESDTAVARVDRDVRRLLYWAMREQGFVVLQQEWWHFEYGTRRWAAITNSSPLYGPGQLD